MTSTVKQLDWIVGGLGCAAYANVLGIRRFYAIKGEAGDWTLEYPQETAMFVLEGLDTQVAARRAAQADYESRVLAALVPPETRPHPALNHDLLERCLPLIINEAISSIESCSNLAWDGADHIPIMGACSPEGVLHAEPLLDLIRDIESEIGPTETPEPEWFESLVDRQWSLSSDIYAVLPQLDERPAHETHVTGADLVAKIAQVASGVGFQANVPALDIAGQILSILAANPEHIDRFIVEGTELFLGGTFNYENGSLTYRAMKGSILSPSVLREKKGQQQ